MRKESAIDVELFARIRYGVENFSTQQKRLCAYLDEHYRDVAFMTVGELADELKIGPATVMRTVRKLGFDSYKDLTGALRTLLMGQPSSTYWPELRRSWEKGERKNIDRSLLEITEANVSCIESSITPSLMESFQRSVAMLKRARKISILGLRSSRAASYYFYFMMNQFWDNVELADVMGSEEVYSNLVSLGAEDVFFAISLGGPSYAARTHEAIAYVHSRGVPVILVTVDPRNPSIPCASVNLAVSSPPGHYSLLATMNLIDALIATLGSLDSEKVAKRMDEMSRVLVAKGIIM